jgi:hypothetical protein
MPQPVRIGNAHGFWGDRLDAAAEMLALEPDLDFLTLDFLAEVSMSILALQRSRDPKAGWPRDFAEVVRSIAPYWRDGGQCRIVTNAGGLNPVGCAQACSDILREAECGDRTVAVVSGDDVLDLVRAGSAKDELLQNLDTGQPITEVKDRLVTANAYLGSRPIADALAQGADLVITGRVADPSLTVGPCAHYFGWAWDEWDRLAGATVAGHLIECGTQLTGGIATDWLQTPEVACIGFPIVEVAEDGTCVVTKPRGSGGRVCEETVKEQLLYEIGDPGAYLSPDVTLSMLAIEIEDLGHDRVAIRGARGRLAPPSYKVSATYQDGYRALGELTIFGADAYAKARRAGEMVLAGLAARGTSFRESLVDCVGAGACRPQGVDPAYTEKLTEVILRIAVADDNRAAVERFSRELMPLVTAGPPGTTGYAAGRPNVQPFFRYWPCLVERDRVTPHVEMLACGADCQPADRATNPPRSAAHERIKNTADWQSAPRVVSQAAPRRLIDIARARSGDKGINANIAVISRNPDDFARLCREITAARVAAYLGKDEASRVTRYEVPNLGALNFVIRGILANPLRVDVQGKALGQVLLEMPLEDQP